MAQQAPNNEALAQALAALAAAITNNNAAIATALANLQQQPHAHGPQLDPIFLDEPLDLSSRAGNAAYVRACAKLDETWDGTVEKFPSFVISLRIRASESNWDAAPPRGILSIPDHTDNTITHDLLTDYHQITEADIRAANIARTDDRAKQNATAMYRALKQSLDGDLKATLFQQVDNLPTVEDGVILFFRLTKFTVLASLQLSMISYKKLLAFDPAEHAFNIPTINTQLNHLFVLATTRDRRLAATERIQHALSTYARIKQPELWAQWVRNKIEDFDEGRLTNCQDFMNSAVLKFNKVISESNGTFQGSTTTLQEDIVAMMANKRKAPVKSDATDDANSNKRKAGAFPPFVKHFRTSNDADAAPYKLGDSKTWQGETWYFCDCPTHRDRHKWHPHTHDTCRTRTRWLNNKDKKPAAANLADVPPAISTPPATTSDASALSSSGASATASAPTSAPPNLTALLASALSLAHDDMTKEFIADALNSIN